VRFYDVKVFVDTSLTKLGDSVPQPGLRELPAETTQVV
jgi:hypothetical protein